MKNRFLTILILVFVLSISMFSLTACNGTYTNTETENLIVELQEKVDANKNEFNEKLSLLEGQFEAKNKTLLEQINANQKELVTLKNEYQAKIAELDLATKANKKEITDLNSEFAAKIEALVKADADNLEELAKVKAEYDAELKKLQDKDLATDKAIADLDAKYLEEVEKLVASDNATAEALANLKTNYDNELKELKDKDLATDKAIADLDAKYLEALKLLAENDIAILQALADLDANYETELKKLQDKDLATDKAIADLDTKYLEEVEKLVASDNATAEALANLKTNYDNELKELKDKDLAIDKAIADLDAKYLEEVEKLVEQDTLTAEALANLKSNYESELKKLQDKDLATDKAIADLDAKYLEEVEKLVKADANNLEELAKVKAEHDAELKKLQDKDLATDKAIADLDAKYLEEVEKLAKADADNLEELAKVKAEYNAELKKLQDKDLATDKAIADLDAKYLEEVEKLEEEIASINELIDKNKTELNDSIIALKQVYDAKIEKIDELLVILQNTDKTQDEKIAELAKKVEEIEQATRITAINFDNNGDLIITFGDGSVQKIEAPKTHVHKCGEWVLFSSVETNCENRIYFRVCEECNYLEWKHGTYNDHSFDASTVEPTCEEHGYTTYTCRNCNYTYNDDIVEALGHTSGDIVVENNVFPTCTEKGSYDNVTYCLDCRKELSRETISVVAKGHTEVIDQALAPTCTEAGLTEGMHCSVCKEVLISQEEIEALGHDFDTVVVNPTCTEQGYTTFTCHCGYSYVDDYIAALGHNYKATTCNNDGTHMAVCENNKEHVISIACDYNYVRNDNGTKEGYCECGHYDFTIDENALIVENGVLTGVTEHGKTLTELVILDDVKEINKGALAGCNSIQSLTVPFVGRNSTDNESAYLGYIFGAEGPTEENPTHLTVIPVSLTEVVVTGKTELGYGALAFLPSVERIEIAEGATVAGYGAFAYNLKLKEAKLPESLNNFIFGAFAFCSELESVEISSKTTIFTEAMFCDCTSLKSVILPSGLKAIGPSAFARTGITDITIPDSVTKIDKWAFMECESLTSVEMSNSVTNIGDFAFGLCPILETITLSKGLVSLGTDVFHRCYNLVDVTIPSGVTSIGDRTFYFCHSLKNIEIPSSVTSIGSEAFAFCYSLTELYIPYCVTHIANNAASNCGGLTVYCERSESEIPSTWDENCGYDATIVLDCKNNDVALDGYIYTIVNGVRYRIKDNIATVAKQARWITSANIQSSITYKGVDYNVTKIESNAFNDCEKLVEITIPDSVEVDTGAFNNSAYYNDANNWQDGIFYISNKIIKVDDNISGTVVIKDGVTSISGGLFQNTNITSVVIPDSVTSIGKYAFGYCSKLTSVVMGNGVKHIGYQAFIGCGYLTEIILSDNLESVEEISFNIYQIKGACNEKDGLYYLPSNNNDYFYLLTADTNIEQANIDENCKIIGAGAFSGCSKLKEILIPESVIFVGPEAFSGCSSLESLTVPFLGKQKEHSGDNTAYVLGYYFAKNYGGYVGNSEYKDYHYYPGKWIGSDYAIIYYVPSTLNNITVLSGEIGDFAFCNCKMLESITLGAGITSIGEDAFYSCYMLKQVNYLGTIDQWAQIEFANSYSNPLNDNGYDEWINDELVEKETNLYVNGELVTDVVLTSATKISAYAFYNCKSLTSITIPASVTFIGKDAFDWCENLTNVYYTGTIDGWVQIEFVNRSSNPLNDAEYLYINNQLVTDVVLTSATRISDYAFYNCKYLTSVTIPASVTYIGDYAFAHCSSITSIKLPEGITFIGEGLFEGCYLLQNVDIPESVKTIGNSAFSECRSLNSIVIPNGVTSIGSNAFSGCESLTTITLPDGIEIIENDLFADCRSLESIEIPNSISIIKHGAFRSCESLVSIHLYENIVEIEDNVFENCNRLTIFCSQQAKPEMWRENWNSNCPVFWGYTTDEEYKQGMSTLLDGIINNLYDVANGDATCSGILNVDYPELTEEDELKMAKYSVEQVALFLQYGLDCYENDFAIVSGRPIVFSGYIYQEDFEEPLGSESPCAVEFITLFNVNRNTLYADLYIKPDLGPDVNMIYLNIEIQFSYRGINKVMVDTISGKFGSYSEWGTNVNELTLANSKIYTINHYDNEEYLTQEQQKIEEFINKKDSEWIILDGNVDAETKDFFLEAYELTKRMNAEFNPNV